jgi:hypothetical protein
VKTLRTELGSIPGWSSGIYIYARGQDLSCGPLSVLSGEYPFYFSDIKATCACIAKVSIAGATP